MVGLGAEGPQLQAVTVIFTEQKVLRVLSLAVLTYMLQKL